VGEGGSREDDERSYKLVEEVYVGLEIQRKFGQGGALLLGIYFLGYRMGCLCEEVGWLHECVLCMCLIVSQCISGCVCLCGLLRGNDHGHVWGGGGPLFMCAWVRMGRHIQGMPPP